MKEIFHFFLHVYFFSISIPRDVADLYVSTLDIDPVVDPDIELYTFTHHARDPDPIIFLERDPDKFTDN